MNGSEKRVNKRSRSVLRFYRGIYLQGHRRATKPWIRIDSIQQGPNPVHTEDNRISYC
jgi:hypothetical protein